MTQPFVALKANAAANATDLGGGLFQTTLTVADDSSVYTGLDIAAGFKLIKGQNGGQMRIYDIDSVDSAFASQVTITVDDVDGVGTPGFGDAAIVQANAAGIFPVPAGIDQGVQQAITQYNLQFSGGGSTLTVAAASSSSLDITAGELSITGPLAGIGGLTPPTTPGTYNLEYDQATGTYAYVPVSTVSAYTPPVVTLNHTGTTVPATGFVAADNLEVFRDGLLQFPSTYTKGAGIITPSIASDDESWLIKKV